MDFNDPIKIGGIKDYVTLKNGIKLKDALRSLDSFADGGQSDGQFTRANFRRLQKMGRFYLKAKNLFAYDTKVHFSTFAQFHKYIVKLALSQRCKDPRNWREKEVIESDMRVKQRVCESFPEPAVPPKRRFRRKTRLKQRTPQPDRSDDNDDILSMRHGPRKQVAALKPSRKPNVKLSDDSLRRIITMPGNKQNSGTLACRNTPKGPKCTMSGAAVAIGTLCKKYRDRLPLGMLKMCPPTKPDMKMIAKTLFIQLKKQGQCISKCSLRNIRRKNPVAHFLLQSILQFLPTKVQCNNPCPDSQDSIVQRVNPDGTVTFRKWRPTFDIAKLMLTFDVSFMIMQARGKDPYAPQKLEYLDRTREKRLAIRKRWNRSIERGYFRTLNSRLLKLWRRKDMSYAAKRWTLFELWDECLENGTSERARKAQRARSMIIAFIRKQLPKGSAHAFTAAELARIAKLRAGESPFKPYNS